MLKNIPNIGRTNFRGMWQLRAVMKKFDDDYKQGNMSRLSSDFKLALRRYGDGSFIIPIPPEISTFCNLGFITPAEFKNWKILFFRTKGVSRILLH